MRHFLELHKTPANDLRKIIQQARQMKNARGSGPKGALDRDLPLKDTVVALIFEKPSTRTRVSFDVGVRQMGGDTLVLTGAEMQLGHGESIADTARVMSRFVDLVMMRTYDENTLLEFARNSSVPVINGLTNANHPCQIMADIMTYEELSGPIEGAKVVWAGDGNNVCVSMMRAAAQFGFRFTFTGPEALDPNPAAVAGAREAGAQIEFERNADRAVEGADLIVTDTWLSMHDAPETREQRHAILRPYQVNAELMARAKPSALFMHCLPAHRGEEVTDEVMDGIQSVVFDEAENRLHAQKAIMRYCLKR